MFATFQDMGTFKAKIYKLCLEEARKLTSRDLKCGENCTTTSRSDGLNQVRFRCPQGHDKIFIKGNWLLLLFRPNITNSSCESSLSPYFVLIDTSGKLKFQGTAFPH